MPSAIAPSAPVSRVTVLTLMPTPSPLGRLIRRRRSELGLTQPELAQRAGAGLKQNDISRLESGKTQKVNDPARLTALAHALGYEDDEEFVLAAHLPHAVRERHSRYDVGPEWEIAEDGELIEVLPRLSVEARRELTNYARYLESREKAS